MYREYFYLLPAEIIGIKSGCSSEEVQDHLVEFNNILKGFEVSMQICLLYAADLTVKKNTACEYLR